MSNEKQTPNAESAHGITVDPHETKPTHEAIVANESDETIEVTPQD